MLTFLDQGVFNLAQGRQIRLPKAVEQFLDPRFLPDHFVPAAAPINQRRDHIADQRTDFLTKEGVPTPRAELVGQLQHQAGQAFGHCRGNPVVRGLESELGGLQIRTGYEQHGGRNQLWKRRQLGQRSAGGQLIKRARHTAEENRKLIQGRLQKRLDNRHLSLGVGKLLPLLQHIHGRARPNAKAEFGQVEQGLAHPNLFPQHIQKGVLLLTGEPDINHRAREQ